MGMAKPMPALWFEPPVAIMLLMPITSPCEFKQRPAGVAGIDGRIGLDSFVDVRAFRAADGPQRADDAARHRSRQSKGIADGEGLLADLQVLGIAQYRGNDAGRVDLNDRQIMAAVASDHLAL